MVNHMTRVLCLLSALTLVACGGGSSSNDNTSNPPTTSTDITPIWTKHIFEDASQFKNKCEVPRTGQNVFGNEYADVAGSVAEEQLWLRSWSNKTYLWYNEIIDQDIAEFTTPQSYFDVLKTLETTNSGQLKDRFHFSQATDDVELSTSGGGNVGYGAELTINGAFPRAIHVLYVEPNSPMADANVSRGAEILFVDGVDVRVGADVDTIVDALLPEEVGEKHTYVIKNVGEAEARTVVLEADAITIEPVHNTRIIDTDTGKIGYLTLNTFAAFTAEKALYDAFTSLKNEEVSDVVIDLRYNSGGFLITSAQLAYMVAGPTLTNNKVFETLAYNDKHQTTDPFSGNPIVPQPFYDTGVGFSVNVGEPLPSLNLNRVFVLSSEDTCSASEAFINGLLGIDVEVILIGDTTCGKPYGFVPTDNCGTTYYTIQFRGENNKGFGDYVDGFAPSNASSLGSEYVTGCQVDDDLGHALGDKNEALLQAALNYRETGTCPTLTVNKTPVVNLLNYEPQLDLRNEPRMIERQFLKEMRLDTHVIQ